MRHIFQIFTIAVVLQQTIFGALLAPIDDADQCFDEYKSIVENFEVPPTQQQEIDENNTRLQALFYGGDNKNIVTHMGLLRVAFSDDRGQINSLISPYRYSFSAKEFARKKIMDRIDTIINDAALYIPVKLLLDLDGAIDELNKKMTSRKRYFYSTRNRFRIYDSDENRHKEFFERFTAILLDPSNKFDELKALFKDQLVSSLIVQVMPWLYDKDIRWLENAGITIKSQNLIDELDQMVLDKYVETPGKKTVIANFWCILDNPIFLAFSAIVVTSSQFLQTATSSVNVLNCGSATIGIETWGKYLVEIIQNISNTTIHSQGLPELQTNSTCMVGYKEEATSYSLFRTSLAIIVTSYAIRCLYYLLNFIFSDNHFFANRKNIASQLKYLLLYIEGHNNQKLLDEFAKYAPKILKRILNKSYRFSSLFNGILEDFSAFNTLERDFKK